MLAIHLCRARHSYRLVHSNGRPRYTACNSQRVSTVQVCASSVFPSLLPTYFTLNGIFWCWQNVNCTCQTRRHYVPSIFHLLCSCATILTYTYLSSYVEDPKWQIKFTIAWTVVLAFVVVIALPRHLVSLFSHRPRRGRWLDGVFGVMEDWRGWNGARYNLLNDQVGEKDLSVSTGAVSKSKCSSTASASSSQRKGRPARTRMAARILSSLGAVFYWTPPGIGLNAGQSLFFFSPSHVKADLGY